MEHKSHFKSLALGLVALLVMSGSAVSQETPRTESADTTALPPLTDILEEVVILEELVVIGTRAQPRSVTESAVPIDVVTGEDFVKQGGSDVQDLLRNVVPSYNVNLQPISDAATVVRPPNLRGLAPDHALVLVNGKRRHRASVIYWLGNGLSNAAQGPDISAIPSIALKRVEVLRDGASAQYGSDAIAGVLNFELKDNYSGGSIEVKPGIFRQGDGGTYALAGNIGLGTPDTWINLSVEYGNADETDRSVQRDDAARLIRVGNTDVNDPAQPWGQPFVRDDLKIFANYGATINDNIEFYGHGNYASKQVEGGFYFRNPNTRGAVYQGPVLMWDGTNYYTQAEAEKLGIVDGVNGNLVATLLVGNMSGGDVPVVPISCSVPDAAALRQVFDDPNLFTFQELFPGGFTPRFGADTEDRAFLAGIKGSTQSLLTWDLSASYGRHHSDFFIFNTVNASLGPNTPTEFNPGDYIQTDTNFNFDITYPFSEQFFFASGLEYRTENFEVVPGQRESFEIGPLASQGFSSASNGFPGFGDIASGSWSRSNWAIYGDAEFSPQENWLLGAALRFENFEDFGSTTNFKVATNYGLNENVNVRGSFSTGFRAPSPGQQNAFNVTTEFGEDDDGNFILVNRGTIPSIHPAAALVGGEGLKPEKSINISAGFIFTKHVYPVDTNIAPLNVTIDYFNISVKDRMTTSSDKALTSQQIEQLEATGINARNLQEFAFFTNDFETKTQGIDFVLTAPVWCHGELSVAYNYTNTEVTKHDPALLDEQRITLLEKGLPRHRGNLTLSKSITPYWSALGRVNYYGSWDEWSVGHQVFGDAFLIDLESSLSLGNGATITAGIQNILDVEPDNIEEGVNPGPIVGRPFGEYSPYGFGGTFLYAKVNYDFKF